jgi:hypothetical protein
MLRPEDVQGTSRAFSKFESYGMLETAASRGWKAKDAIEWCSGTGEALFAPCSIWTVLAQKILEQQFRGSDGPISVSQ